VFVSYAYDSPAHRAAVHRLSALLRSSGVDVQLDDYDSGERRDWYAWMIDQIEKADYVIVVGSPNYRKFGNGGAPPSRSRGVQAEAAVLREKLYADRSTWTRKILPVVLSGGKVDDIPTFLQPFSNSHYIIPELTPSGIEQLLRTITGQPLHTPPNLGPIPTFGPTIPTQTASAGLLGRRRLVWLAIAVTVVIVVAVAVVLARLTTSGAPAASRPPATSTDHLPTTIPVTTTTAPPPTTAAVGPRWHGTLQLGGFGGPGGGWYLDYVPPQQAITGDLYYSDINEIDTNNSIVPWNRPYSPSENQCATLLNTHLGLHTFDAVVGNTACFTTSASRVGFLTVTATPGANDINPTISVDALVWQKP